MPQLRKLTDEERDDLMRRTLARDKLRAWLIDAKPGDIYAVTIEDGEQWRRLPYQLGQYAAKVGLRLAWLKGEGDAHTRYFEVKVGAKRRACEAAEIAAPATAPAPSEPTESPPAQPNGGVDYAAIRRAYKGRVRSGQAVYFGPEEARDERD